MIDETTYQKYLKGFTTCVANHFPWLNEEQKEQIKQLYVPCLRNVIESFHRVISNEGEQEELIGKKYLAVGIIINIIKEYLEEKRHNPYLNGESFLSSLAAINQTGIEEIFGPAIAALRNTATYVHNSMENNEGLFPELVLDQKSKIGIVKLIDSTNSVLLKKSILPELEKVFDRLTTILYDRDVRAPASRLAATNVEETNETILRAL